jgi:hypothetical protein
MYVIVATGAGAAEALLLITPINLSLTLFYASTKISRGLNEHDFEIFKAMVEVLPS